VDKISESLAEDCREIHKNEKVQEFRRKLSRLIGVPEMSIFPIKSYTTEVERSAFLEMAVLSLLCEAALRARNRVDDILGGHGQPAMPLPTLGLVPVPVKDPKPHKTKDSKNKEPVTAKGSGVLAPGGPRENEETKYADRSSRAHSQSSARKLQSRSGPDGSSSSSSAAPAPASKPVTAHQAPFRSSLSSSQISSSSVSSLASQFTHLSTAPVSNTVSPLISLSRPESPGLARSAVSDVSQTEEDQAT